MEEYPEYLKGRGAQLNPKNPYQKLNLDTQAEDGLDEALVPSSRTEFIIDRPKKIINKVSSPDIPMDYSMNPYQGCEHGCIYCYARNSHQYWGYSAGLDFERKIIVKPNAPALLEKELQHPKWEPKPVMFSGNTDCYQPIERKMEITRKCLEIFLKYKHPVGLITKNSLVLRDLDLLKELAKDGLVHVFITITSLDESLRRLMEPRTASSHKRLDVVKKLSEANIPVGVMLGPIIPGLNNHEIPNLVKRTAEVGALTAAYTFVRLNGAVGELFEDWIRKNFPDRADKVLSQIKGSHGGSLSDSRFGTRMSGEGEIAKSISQLFHLMKKKHYAGRKMPRYNLDAFRRTDRGQMRLF